jgi:hypothetical protein
MNKCYISNQRYAFIANTAKSTLLIVIRIIERGGGHRQNKAWVKREGGWWDYVQHKNRARNMRSHTHRGKFAVSHSFSHHFISKCNFGYTRTLDLRKRKRVFYDCADMLKRRISIFWTSLVFNL